MAANPFPRRTFVIAGEAGQADRTINMIEIDDALKTAVLALLNAATTDQRSNPNPAIGLMAAAAAGWIVCFCLLIEFKSPYFSAFR